ncbi:MAG: hypothetical protein M1814_005150 [Vezdaea aestivalis]|nr:MAG: hypothetical protein M1814_005150 [Vezdaea aestivalis]
MSASGRLAAQVASRRSLTVNGARHAGVRRSTGFQPSNLYRHHQQPYISALAILVPQRTISTETSSSTGGAGGPPPGFNVEQAKKPLPQEEVAANATKSPDIDSAKNVTSTTIKSQAAHPTELSASQATAVETKVEGKKEETKLTIGQKVKREIQHYWDGTKLLATEVKISMKLALKMAAGYELSRRENRQLQRTVQDLGRLVPFSVFVIVPFAELLLPVALKLFPNLLPSTYEGQKSKDAKATSLRATRKEVSNFLRNTLKETGLPISKATTQRDDFTEFFRKVRATGETPSEEDVIKICKTFKDDLTLDNLSRPQLVGMCRYINLGTFGTDTMLRYTIRHRMRQIKRDDRAISFEGVESLSVTELQTACASRGLRTQGLSPGRLRDDLSMWLDLRLKYGVPSTLLVLSNAFVYAQGKESEIGNQIEALQAVLSSIPEELFHEIELEVHNAEGAATNKQRLEVLKEQQELIEEENQQSDEDSSTGRKPPKDDKDIDDEERKVDAAEEGQDTEQVSEAVDAEKDGQIAEEKVKASEGPSKAR